MHTIHRNELPLGCNISLLFKRKLDITLSSYAPISQLLSDYSPCLVEALLMGCNRYWSHCGVSSNGQGEPRHGRRVSTGSSSIVKLKGIIPTVSWQCSVAHARERAPARTQWMKPRPIASTCTKKAAFKLHTQSLLLFHFISCP